MSKERRGARKTQLVVDADRKSIRTGPPKRVTRSPFSRSFDGSSDKQGPGQHREEQAYADVRPVQVWGRLQPDGQR